MLNHFKVVQLLVLAIKVLGSVVEYLHLVHGMHLLVCFLLQFTKFNFIIKASTCAASSSISGCLPLPLDRLDDFACLRIDLAKWIHAHAVTAVTSLAAWMHKVVAALAKSTLTGYSTATCCSCRWSHDMSLTSMVHLRLLVEGGRYVEARWRTTHHKLVGVLVILSDISWVLLATRLYVAELLIVTSRCYNWWILHSIWIVHIDTSTTRISLYSCHTIGTLADSVTIHYLLVLSHIMFFVVSLSRL